MERCVYKGSLKINDKVAPKQINNWMGLAFFKKEHQTTIQHHIIMI